MSFLTAIQADEIRDKLVTEPSVLGKIYKAKKSEYHLKSVDHSLVDEMLKEEWEEYTTPLKTKTKLRKPKRHDKKFEDDVWCQLYELGYKCLNFDENFRLPYGKNDADRKQIDVIAIDDDSILLIECKSSERPKKAPSFKTEFEGLRKRLDGFAKSLEQVFGKGRKIKYVFATRNLRMDSEGSDIQRLLEEKAFPYNENTYEYINSLIKHYKDAAHYQFLALLYKGQAITKDRIEVPAIEGKMGGKTYYMFSIEPHLLLRMGFILHRTRANESEMPTYQRLLVPSRLRGITKFIEGGGFFPNSVILNFGQTRLEKPLFEGSSKGQHSNSRFGTIKIPNAYAIAYIIDGQHRIYGYANSPYRETNTIPVVAFVGLESSEQLRIFMDINQNQKAVSATLRLTLEEDLYWDSDRADSRIKALRSSIIRMLSVPINGPLHNKISIGEDKAHLSANPFATALSKSGLLPSARGNTYRPEDLEATLYNTNNQNHAAEMKRSQRNIVKFLNLCYEYVEEHYPDIFNTEQYIISNRGTFAFVCLIGSLNKYETSKGSIKVSTSPKDRFSAIEKYLKVFLDRLSRLDADERERLLGKLGSGAENVWLRSYQTFVHKKFSDFDPTELIDWRERQDDDLQSAGRKLGIKIERYMKGQIIKKLKKLFDENWDLEIGSIQRECDKRAREEQEKQYKDGLGRNNIPWTDMFFITDYKKIIEKYWTTQPKEESGVFTTFEDDFAIDAGFGFQSKSDKVKWISVFNSHRNLWAHEGTKEKRLNREEVKFLQSIHDHLLA